MTSATDSPFKDIHTLGDLADYWKKWSPREKGHVWRAWLVHPQHNGWLQLCGTTAKLGDYTTLDAWLNAAREESDKLGCILYHLFLEEAKNQAQNQAQHEQQLALAEKRNELLRACLHCARLLTKHTNVFNSDAPLDAELLKPVAGCYGLALGGVRDLVEALRNQAPQQSKHQLMINVPLVQKKGSDPVGVLAKLRLELMPEGECKLYPALPMIFVERDQEFEAALDNAAAACQKAHWPGGLDVRWHLERRDGQPIFSLLGDSAGGAFALGIGELLNHAIAP
jgi:hypothetical protein